MLLPMRGSASLPVTPLPIPPPVSAAPDESYYQQSALPTANDFHSLPGNWGHSPAEDSLNAVPFASPAENEATIGNDDEIIGNEAAESYPEEKSPIEEELLTEETLEEDLTPVTLEESRYQSYLLQEGMEAETRPHYQIGNLVILQGSNEELPSEEEVIAIVRQQIVQEAMNASRYEGIPYELGGKSMEADINGNPGAVLDCSGFTRRLFREVLGIDIGQGTPHQEQGKIGTWSGPWEYDNTEFTAVSERITLESGADALKEIEPGTLVFLSPNEDGIDHVVLYLGENSSGKPLIAEFSETAGGWNVGELPEEYVPRLSHAQDLLTSAERAQGLGTASFLHAAAAIVGTSQRAATQEEIKTARMHEHQQASWEAKQNFWQDYVAAREADRELQPVSPFSVR
jgi:cell wall-associated NlpC family hydrolase